MQIGADSPRAYHSYRIPGVTKSCCFTGLAGLSVVAALVVSGCVFVTMATGKPGLGGAFSWHPICMTFGFMLFMAHGIVAYRAPDEARLGDGDCGLPGWRHHSATVRKAHAWLQGLAGVMVLAGLATMIAAHWGKSQFGGDTDDWRRKMHVWVGWLVVVGVTIQIVVGPMKLVRKMCPPGGGGGGGGGGSGPSPVADAPFAKWHGKLGMFVWVLGTTNVVIASMFWAWPSGGVQASVQLFAFVQLFVVAALYFGLHATCLGSGGSNGNGGGTRGAGTGSSLESGSGGAGDSKESETQPLTAQS